MLRDELIVRRHDDAVAYEELRPLAFTPPPQAAARRGMVRKPPRSHEYYKNIIEDAIATDAAPTPELVRANKILTAWEAYLGIGEVSSFPVTTQIGLTDICNARCSFCIYSPSNSFDRRVTLEDVQRLNWLKFVERFSTNAGLNEPLINPQAIPILDAVRNHAPFIKMFLVSNMSIMSDDIATGLVRHLDHLLISLNAVRKDSYESIMSLPWETTIDNIRKVASYKKAAGASRLNIEVSVVVHMRNLDELVEAPALLASVGVDRLRIIVMSNVVLPIADRKTFSSDDHISNDPKRANRVFAELEDECKRYGITIVGKLPWVQENVGGKFDEAPEAPRPNRQIGKDVSKEYLYPAFEEAGAYCLRPWRMLKVDLDRSTMICNGSFTRMPKFDFPTMKEFHRTDKTWNHPFMQHLRRSRGQKDEVPFCTLCLSVDKRHPIHKAERKIAMDESRLLFRKFDTESRSDQYLGRLNKLPEVLDDVEVPLRSGVVKPFGFAKERQLTTVFGNTRSEFRWLVYSRGFFGAKRVLMFGLQRFAFAPFLAESCESLTLSDLSVTAVSRAAQLCRTYGLPVTTSTVHEGHGLKFEDESFDRIWVDGALLCKVDAAIWLPALRRILKPSGVLFVHKAPALGAFLSQLAREKDATRRGAMNATLQTGFGKEKPIRCFPARDLRMIVNQNGFSLDRNVVVSKYLWTRDRTALDDLKAHEIDVLKARYLTDQTNWKRPGLIEFYIDMSLIKR